jgi:hypothetical protein
MIEEEIYSGVDVRQTFEETDEYIDGYEYENYSDALNQYNKLNESE